MTKKFTDALAEGATEAGAAASCGWKYDTYQEWLRRGLALDHRPETEMYARFASAVLEARGTARVLAEAETRRKYPLPWLYNRYPEDWHPPTSNVRIVNSPGGLDDDIAEQYREQLIAHTNTNGNGKPHKDFNA